MHLAHAAQQGAPAREHFRGHHGVEAFGVEDAGGAPEVDVGVLPPERRRARREQRLRDRLHPSQPRLVMRAPRIFSMCPRAHSCCSGSKLATQSAGTSTL